MRTSEIIKEIQRLPVKDRILVIEKTVHSLRIPKDSNLMKKAAERLYTDYISDKDLTLFTNLDFEDFYETR